MTSAITARQPDDPLNVHVANVLDETAQLLEDQPANAFRVQAYRNAANTVRSLERGVDDILDAEGLDHAVVADELAVLGTVRGSLHVPARDGVHSGVPRGIGITAQGFEGGVMGLIKYRHTRR